MAAPNGSVSPKILPSTHAVYACVVRRRMLGVRAEDGKRSCLAVTEVLQLWSRPFLADDESLDLKAVY